MSFIKLRRAVFSDARNLWLWRNDKATRKSAFSMDRVPWAGHKAWFQRRLEDKNCRIYIIEANGKPVGQIRFDKHGQNNEVDIAVAPQARGRGIAAEALKTSILSSGIGGGVDSSSPTSSPTT